MLLQLLLLLLHHQPFYDRPGCRMRFYQVATTCNAAWQLNCPVALTGGALLLQQQAPGKVCYAKRHR